MEGIKNLIIDLGGVLINLTRNRCIEAFENLGVENIREQITNNYQHKDLFERLELGTISVEQFRDDIRALSGKPLTDEQIDTAWIAMLGDVPENKLRLLLELRERYNTMLLSNTHHSGPGHLRLLLLPPAPVLDLQLLRLHPRAGGRVGGHHRVLQLLLL